MQPLRLGVLVDTEKKRTLIQHVVMQTGQKVDYCAVLPEVGSLVSESVLALDDLEKIAELDAWIVDVTQADSQSAIDDILPVLLATANVPVVLSDSSEIDGTLAAEQRWKKRLQQRLQRLIGEVNLQTLAAAQDVWVLAASTGGPEAVCEFLQALPDNLGVGFLYVQHINQGYSPTLVNMVNRTCHYRADIAHQGSVVVCNSVTVIDAQRRVEILENSTLVMHEEPWGGCYQPSIDQLAANLARTHRQHSGLIIFSGMGEDGAASCRFIKQQGGHVFVQSPSSCVVGSMPEAALQTQCVDVQASPAQLAQELSHIISRTTPIEERNAHESSATN